MPKYKKVDVTEQQLEDLVRRHAEDIEDGLVYVDHQMQVAGGRLDVLMMDSGKSLVVAELKVIEDDGMLLQAIDYYDFVSTHVEAFARLHKNHSIDPTQQVRLFLVAPSFSQTMINRCKWVDIPLSLFTYNCLKFDGAEDLVTVFSEQAIPSPPEIIEVFCIEDHLSYITDKAIREKAASILEEIKGWKQSRITMDALKYAVSMKVDNRVFGYLYTRRKHFILATYNIDDKWTEYAIHGEDDLQNVLPLMKTAMEKRCK